MESGRLLLEAAKGSFGLVLSHALDSPAEVAITLTTTLTLTLTRNM